MGWADGRSSIFKVLRNPIASCGLASIVLRYVHKKLYVTDLASKFVHTLLNVVTEEFFDAPILDSRQIIP